MFNVCKKLFVFSAILFSFGAHAESVSDLFQHSGAPVGGNSEGKVTVVEFFDYRCALCVHTSEVMDEIVKANPNVRVIYMDYPILGDISDAAARAALAANLQGRYQELSQTLLMGRQLYTEDAIFDSAKILGLDIDKLDKDMDSESIVNQLKTNYMFAQEFNIHSTPAFIIGKTDAKDLKDVQVITDDVTKEHLEDAIKDAAKV